MPVSSEEIDALIEEVRRSGCCIPEQAIADLRPLLEELIMLRMAQQIREAARGIQP